MKEYPVYILEGTEIEVVTMYCVTFDEAVKLTLECFDPFYDVEV